MRDFIAGRGRREDSDIRIGRFNTLTVVKLVDFGCYLDGGNEGEILMPAKYMPEGLKVGDEVRVFVYYDSDDRIVATTETPLAEVGQVAFLTVKEVNSPGAFLDWGLVKDLLCPRGEQRDPMIAGHSYVVYVYQDESSGRIAATSKFARFLDNVMPRYQVGDAADAIVTDLTPLGYKLAVDNAFTGLVYNSDVFGAPLLVGQKLKVYVKKVRDDDRIDFSLTPLGYAKVDGLSAAIIAALQANGGFLPLGDKSSPDAISEAFGCSKKSFKMTIGTLMKQGQIVIRPDGIALR